MTLKELRKALGKDMHVVPFFVSASYGSDGDFVTLGIEVRRRGAKKALKALESALKESTDR